MQRDCQKKKASLKMQLKGHRCFLRKREERKKMQLKLMVLCKVHLLALFPPHFPFKLGG